MSYTNDQQGAGTRLGPDEAFAVPGRLRIRSQKKFMEIHSYDTPNRPANTRRAARRSGGARHGCEFAEAGLKHATVGNLGVTRVDVGQQLTSR